MELTAPNGLSPIPREQRVVIFVLAFFAGWTRLKYSNVQYLEIFMLLHLSYLMLQLGLRGFTTHLQGLWKTPGRAYGLVMFAILLMSISSIRLPLYPPIYGPYFLHVPLLVVGLRYIELFVVAFYCLYAAELMRRDHRLRDFGLKWYVKSAVITAWMTFAALVIFKITGFAPSSVTDAARGQGMFPEGGPWGLYLVTVAMVTRILWKRKTISHKQMIFVAGTLMYAFYLSRSKSAALATLLIFITQVFFGHNLKQKLTSIVAIGAVCAAAMWIFDVPMLFRMYVELQQKAEVIVWLNRADPNTAYGRVAASVIVPRMIAKHPITGIGVGNYSVMRNDPDYLGIMWPNRDYDLPGLGLLAVAAELGIPCLIGLYGMMLYPAFRVRFAHGNAALLTLALCQPYVHLMGAQITIFYPWMASAFVLSLPASAIAWAGKAAGAGRPPHRARSAAKARRPGARDWPVGFERRTLFDEDYRMTTTSQPVGGIPNVANLATDDAWLDETAGQGTKISVFDVFLVLVRQRLLIFVCTVVCGLFALFTALRTPKQYESSVTILPPAQVSTRAIGGSINDLSSALSTGASFSFNAKEDFWTAVMKGHTILDRIIVRQGLMQEYHVKLMSQAESALKSRTSFDIDKAGLITINVRDPNPARAAQLADAYIEAMHQSMVDMAIDDANQRASFYKSQVEEEEAKLRDAEAAMMEMQHKTGVLEISGQTSEAIRTIGDLRAKVTVLTVQLQALRASATDENPEVQRLKAELGADQAALARAESSQGSNGLGDIDASDVPKASLDYIHAARDLRYHESLTEALGKQVEAARMDEARSAPMVQIVDPAMPSDHPSGLSRSTMVLIGLGIGFILGIVLAILRQGYWNVKASAEGQEKWQRLVDTLKGRA